MAARKNSLVENINRRKRAGKSRPKSRSTISPGAYEAMQQGWPGKKKKAKRKGKAKPRQKARRKQEARPRHKARRTQRRGARVRSTRSSR